MAASGITKGEHCPGWGEGESELQRVFFFLFWIWKQQSCVCTSEALKLGISFVSINQSGLEHKAGSRRRSSSRSTAHTRYTAAVVVLLA
jgi:hypothetical protein